MNNTKSSKSDSTFSPMQPLESLTNSEIAGIRQICSALFPGCRVLGRMQSVLSWDIRPIIEIPGHTEPVVIRLSGPELMLSKIDFQNYTEQIVNTIRFFGSTRSLISCGDYDEQFFYCRSLVPSTLAHDLAGKKLLPFTEILSLSLEIALALKNLHQNNIFHGHLTLDNIYRNGSDQLVFLDYAIGFYTWAAIGNINPDRINFFYDGASFPPEVFEGSGDKSADVYSLGIIFNHLLSRLNRDDAVGDDQMSSVMLAPHIAEYKELSHKMCSDLKNERLGVNNVADRLLKLKSRLQSLRTEDKNKSIRDRDASSSSTKESQFRSPSDSASQRDKNLEPRKVVPIKDSKQGINRESSLDRPTGTTDKSPQSELKKPGISPSVINGKSSYQEETHKPTGNGQPTASDSRPQRHVESPAPQGRTQPGKFEPKSQSREIQPREIQPSNPQTSAPKPTTPPHRQPLDSNRLGGKPTLDKRPIRTPGFIDTVNIEPVNIKPVNIKPVNIDPLNVDSGSTGMAHAEVLKETAHHAIRTNSRKLLNWVILLLGILSVVLFGYILTKQQSTRNYSKEELELMWDSGLRSQSDAVILAAIDPDSSSSLYAENLLIASALSGKKSNSPINLDFLKFALDPRWETQLSHEDKKVAIIFASLEVLNQLEAEIPHLGNKKQHPAVTLALTAFALDQQLPTLKKFPASDLNSLPSNVGPAFDALTKLYPELTCGDEPARELAKIVVYGISNPEVIFEFLGRDVQQRLHILAILYSSDEKNAGDLVDVILNHPNFRINTDTITWANRNRLLTWVNVPNLDKLLLLVGLPPKGRFEPNNLARLFDHPIPAVRGFAIQKSLNEIKFGHPGSAQIFTELGKDPKMLTPQQTVYLAQMLEVPYEIKKSQIERFLETSPPVPLLAEMLVSSSQQKTASSLDFFLFRHLHQNQWVPTAEQLKLLVFHPEKLTRLYSYSLVFRLENKETSLKLLTEAQKRETDPTYNEQLLQMIDSLKKMIKVGSKETPSMASLPLVMTPPSEQPAAKEVPKPVNPPATPAPVESTSKSPEAPPTVTAPTPVTSVATPSTVKPKTPPASGKK